MLSTDSKDQHRGESMVAASWAQLKASEGLHIKNKLPILLIKKKEKEFLGLGRSLCVKYILLFTPPVPMQQLNKYCGPPIIPALGMKAHSIMKQDS